MAVLGAAIWQIAPVGTITNANNANGGGYDGTNYPGGTDYTLLANTPSSLGGPIISFAAGSTSAANATFVDSTNSPFTSAMVGNALHIVSGTNFTAGWYFITAFTSSTTVTLDRTCATAAGASGVYRVGGIWPDFTNITTSTPVVAGNTVNIRGSGSDHPTSNDYALGGRITPVNGSAAGWVHYIGINGRPRIKVTSDRIIFNGVNTAWFENLYLAADGAGTGFGLINSNGASVIKNCVFDQVGNDACLLGAGQCIVIDCEFLNSGTRGTATQSPLNLNDYGTIVVGCNIHDLTGDGIQISNAGFCIANNIIAKCSGNGILSGISAVTYRGIIQNNTIDGNLKDGIQLTLARDVAQTAIFNNIISNHNQAGKYGVNLNFGSAAANVLLANVLNYNDLYNNTTNFNNFTTQTDASTGATGDSTLDPTFAAQSTEGYQIGTNLKALALPQAAFRQNKSGQTATQSYVDMGAVQRQETGGGAAGMLYVPGMAGGMEG